jgi:anaerobic magnesium-protoporphyrin IX monomethyl ester cyclase
MIIKIHHLKGYLMKILFVRPPRYMWPMNSESSSFWQPLGFASMAAVLRENGFRDIEILDCCIEKIGWKSLKKIIQNKKYDVLCVGEEVSSVDEAFKLIKLSKHYHPSSKIICGGYYFTHMTQDLKKYPIDFIIRFEGEYTLLELLKEFLKKNPKYSKIKGIAYLKNRLVKLTPERKLCDLETLPLPAYDLLKMHLYGKNSKNHKDFIAIEHGRGCAYNCNFCSLWRQMGNNGQSCYRTKSPEKTFKEVKFLIKKYKRKTINWVDGTHNMSSEWLNKFSDLMIKSGLKINQTAWMRADCIIRDHNNGVLKKSYDTGLIQVNIGIERIDNAGIDFFNKKNNYSNTSLDCLNILKKYYPKILKLISVIYGIPNETKKSLRKLTKLLDKKYSDVCFFIPFTPYPGTEMFNKLYQKGCLNRNFRNYNLIKPILDTKKYSKEKIFKMMKWEIMKKIFMTPSTYNSFFIFGRKSRIQISIAKKTLKYLFLNQINIKPRWYDK